MITKDQQKCIDKCKSAGYGWKSFAEFIEKQGWCSEKQETKLIEMYSKIQLHEYMLNGNFKHSITPDFPFDGELTEPSLNEI